MRAAIHEMRNHLCVAMAGIEAFLDGKLEPNGDRLNAVFQALRDVDLLIDDLPCDVAVRLPTRVVPLDVCALLATRVTAMEGVAAEHGVRLNLVRCTLAHGDRSDFLGDPIRIAQIVTNIVINAIRHSPPGGVVDVAIRRDAAGVRCGVSDQGPGIAVPERARIFERGYRGPARGFAPGSGLGLALVKQFVEHAGGTIRVGDAPGHGATFVITLPCRMKSANAVVGPAVRSRPFVRGRSSRHRCLPVS